jgi:hypothetical protein
VVLGWTTVILLSIAFAHCQTPPVSQPAPSPALALSSPSNYFLLGSEATASTHPQPAGLAAICLNVGADTCSFTMYSVFFSSGKLIPTTSTTTGVAKVLWSLAMGRVKASIVGLATVGAATTGTATTSAFNGGGGVLLEHVIPKWDRLGVWLGAIEEKNGSNTSTLALIALSWRF